MKFKLSPTFLLAIIAMASALPLAMGISVPSVAGAALVVVCAALLVERSPSSYRGAHGQLGKIGAEDLEAQYRDVSANLKKVGDDLKAHAEQAQKDIQTHQKMSEETKAEVDKLLLSQTELTGRLSTLEQLLASGKGGDGGKAAVQSLGAKVIEHEDFASNANKLAMGKGSFSVPVQAAITSAPDSAGDLIEPQRVAGILTPPERRLTIRDLLSWGRTQSNSVEYVRETGFTNNADVVSENPSAGKPESGLNFELDSAKVATIAHWVHASKQVLSDASMLAAHIDGRLRYGLKLKEELQLLKGSGVGLNINGLYTQASDYANPGVVVQDETIIDRLRIAMLQVQLAEYTADGLVLNPIDWATIELTKDTQNRYLLANPTGLAGPVLWGLPVVATQSMDQNDFLTGAFRMGAQAWDREDATVTVSTEDRDNFIKNMVTILAEERLALTVYRPEAFVKGPLTDAS
ncbi:major head protein [Alcanivorax xiamenensis]|uniref:Major head protein n=1 Tax=Alcanivorax xiamenensis TaxID=1177156 RepID=A0ABQ6Y6F8_9GAMM|nr:phage major capsid protein [Alcanivorax xiamenensis]KAF0804924.1 major head protein [Alcanivorax xiamenensis]